MPSAVVDTTVLYAAGNRRTHRHEEAFAIVRGSDRGELPTLLVPDPVLIETMNGLVRDVGHDSSVEFLERLRAGAQFDVIREPMAVWSGGVELFRTYPRLSLADAVVLTAARHHDLEYCYSFDDDFDGFDDVTRLDHAANPFAPE